VKLGDMFGSFGKMMKSFQHDINSIFDDSTGTDGRGYNAYYSSYGMPQNRTYISGWAPRVERSEAVSRPTIQDTGLGLAHSVTYQPLNAAGKDDYAFGAIKARCLASRTLWEDPDFPPVARSLYYKKAPSAWPNIVWKRPHEICTNPELFVDGGSRMDVVQGILGDCWLLAAVASVSTNPSLLSQVIPPGQSFQSEYAGVFRFRFWQYGRWVEVLVDDRLPTTNGKLIYMHSDTRNEFWSALLEKAYAKLNGSYEALSGGLTSEALEDLTGGVVERFELGSRAPSDLLQTMLQAMKKSSLMGCSIDAAGGRMEEQLRNGLMMGHAYSITDLRKVRVQTSRVSGEVPLIRIRNPWGDEHEWNGAWSDQSPEWTSVPQSEKASLGLTFEHDGEFWMSFKDFTSSFQRLEICYLGPDSLGDCDKGDGRASRKKWEGALFEGSWRRRVNAGGCRNYPSTFWINPQYRVTISAADSGESNGNGTVIVALMQKDRRKLRKEGKTDLTIGYAVYKALATDTGTLDAQFFRNHAASARSTEFTNLREVCNRHQLPPGNYVIVPSTFEPNEEGDFILRFYSEREADSARELDDVTGVVDIPKPSIVEPPKPEEKSRDDESRQKFLKLAGSDGEIDAYELQSILNLLFKREFQFDGFTVDMTRSMVAMHDEDFTGKIGFEEYKKLWADLNVCRRAFNTLDTNHDGYFNSYEFRNALNTLGFRVSNATFNAIVMRYSDKDGHVHFNDFVAAYMKLKTLFELFNKKDPSNLGKARFNVEEFMMFTMYS
jgi:calpain